MHQSGFYNSANIGTYNDVAGNQINYNINNPEYASVIQDQADIAAIRSLRIAENPGGNQHQTCADKTRVQILHDIRIWAEDSTTTNQIFWLADQAGTGKSTVAKQIAKDWETAAKPVASFFFSINAADTRTNTKFCPSIAAKLASLRDFGSFRSTLAEALRNNLTVETCGFSDQFEQLICTPLKKTNRPALIIIDALDECSKRDRYELLSVLLNKLDQISMIKFMITSRPEPDITKLLQKGGSVRSSNLRGSGDVDSSIQDVLQYVSNFFAHSDELQSVQSYAPMVAKEANGLFIYAATACEYLKNSVNLDASLEVLEHTSGLDDLYSQIMERAITKKDTISLQAVSLILQTILVAQRPLSISEMRELLKEDDMDILSVVTALASVVSSGADDKPVEILHPTFQEYLTDRGRSGVYFIDLKQGHKSLAIACLEACSGTGATQISRTITSTLGYAALYWPVHAAAFFREANARVNDVNEPAHFSQSPTLQLEQSGPAQPRHRASKENSLSGFKKIFLDRRSPLKGQRANWLGRLGSAKFGSLTPQARDDIQLLEDRILSLFKKDLVRWFELIVLVNAVYQCTKNLATLETSGTTGPVTVTGSTSKMSECVHWCRDAQRFLQHHQPGIEQGYTHVQGAIAFTPKESLIYKMYFGTFSHQIPIVLSGIPVNWPSHRTLLGHTRSVSVVVFSQEGTRLVSGSRDNTLRLWDGVTGASIGGPMHGHTDAINCLAFSPDGTRVVSGSDDNTLRLWDGVTGVRVGGSMNGHTDAIHSVAFSPDGARIVSCSADNTLRLWNGVTGASIGRSMYGHTNEVNCVAFSPNDTRIVSGSDDNTLRFWDSMTGASIGEPMYGHADTVSCVAFSPDSSRIISGSRDHTLRLWDGMTGASIGRSMNGHTGMINSVSFSPDGTHIVSGSQDTTLRLWDGITGARISGPMNGHTQAVTSLAFSPDGARIVSGSDDNTLRLWNAMAVGRGDGILNGHNNMVNCVAFSPDGARVVSASWDKTLRLWDGLKGENSIRPINAHTKLVCRIAFSLDGTRVVSGSFDNTLRLWDGVTGVSIGGPMYGHTNIIHDVNFSSDGSRVVSSSEDQTVRLWDVFSGAEVAVIYARSYVSEVNFSTCGSYIVSFNSIWDIRATPPFLVKGVSPLLSTQPSSPIRYDLKTRRIELYIPPVFSFPVSGCQVHDWVAQRGCIALGLEDGRVMIIDCTHLL